MESSGKSKYKRHGREWGRKENKLNQSMRARLKMSSRRQIDEAVEKEIPTGMDGHGPQAKEKS